MSRLEQVSEFHNTFEAPILDTPQIPSKERCNLRISLIQEELDELKQAIADNDLVEVADALCDIEYVLLGTVLEFGLGKKFQELFDEVQRSNMSKACVSQEEAEATVKWYEEKDVSSYWVKRGEKWFVYRVEDKKALKSVNYSPVDLKRILNRTEIR